MTYTPLPERKTGNGTWYINICLPKVFEACSARHPHNSIHSLLLNHNNASIHTAATTLDYLEANRTQLVTQTPFFLGLAPCDFFLSPQVKWHLKGK